MTREQCLFLAKKLYVELVYNTAYIEGVNVTFPQTQTIIDGGIVNDVPINDIQTVLNLRDGWKFVLNSIDAPLTLDYICKVNEHVSRNESLEWGVLRTGVVGISGTDYLPPVPQRMEVERAIDEINNITDPTDRAMEYFCYAVRSQLFWDGNKRTSTMVASKILIENSVGVLTIDAKNALRFNDGLNLYYSTADKTLLLDALKGCVKTMDLQPERTNIKDKLAAAKIEADRLNSERAIGRGIIEPNKYDRGR